MHCIRDLCWLKLILGLRFHLRHVKHWKAIIPTLIAMKKLDKLKINDSFQTYWRTEVTGQTTILISEETGAWRWTQEDKTRNFDKLLKARIWDVMREWSSRAPQGGRGFSILLQVFSYWYPTRLSQGGSGKIPDKVPTLVLYSWGKQYPLWNSPRPPSFIISTEQRLNLQEKGLKTDGMRTLVDTHYSGEKEEDKEKEAPHWRTGRKSLVPA